MGGGHGDTGPKLRAKRSPSNQLRNRLRRADWLQRRAGQHDSVPVDRIWLLDRLCKTLMLSTGRFGTFLFRFQSGAMQSTGRNRNLFPLPLLGPEFVMPSGLVCWQAKILRNFVNMVLLSLNYLHGVPSSTSLPAKGTAAQLDVMCRTVQRCMDFYTRLQSVSDGCWEHLLPDWIPDVIKPEGPKYCDLKADAVDGIPVSGACDPLDALPSEVRSVVLNERLLFSNANAGLGRFEGIARSEQIEYVKLVAKQLRSGKVGLADSVLGGGPVLAVSKPGTGKLREVWHGRRVSQAAAAPPPPRHLASPTALLHLEASADHPVRVSKRDARCWFDQLSLPPQLRVDGSAFGDLARVERHCGHECTGSSKLSGGRLAAFQHRFSGVQGVAHGLFLVILRGPGDASGLLL